MTNPISSDPAIELSQDTVIMFGSCALGIQRQFIEEKIESVRDDISQRLHDELSESDIFPDDAFSEDCFLGGYSCRVLQPGQNWTKGRLRFRIVTEFIPDRIEVTNEPEQPIEPSLDTFR